MSPENIEHWVSDYGYGIILLGTYFDHYGIPLFIVFGGIAASTDTLNVFGVALCGFLGGWIGDLFLYFLGYKTGLDYWRQFAWVRKMDGAIETVDRMLRLRPALVVVLGRFLFAVSKLVPPFAGMVRYDVRRYIVFSFLGNLLFAGAYTALSFASGKWMIDQLGGFKLASIFFTLIVLGMMIALIRRLKTSA